MKRYLLILFFCTSLCYAHDSTEIARLKARINRLERYGIITVSDNDNEPRVRNVREISFTSGAVSDAGGGVANINLAAADVDFPHELLDGSSHPDSVINSAAQGSIIYGNAEPKWDELTRGSALGGTATGFLGYDGTDVGYRTLAEIITDLGLASTYLKLDASNDPVTGVLTVEGLGTGGQTDYDLKVGDVDGSPTYGMIQMGNSSIGRTSFSAGNIDLDGAILVRNIAGPITGEIEFVWAESTGDTCRFALPKSAVGNATYNSRSMLLAGPAPSDTDFVKVSYWQTANSIFDNLACDTSGTGADLGVQNDLEVEGDIFCDSFKESTSGGGYTYSPLLDISDNTNLAVDVDHLKLTNDTLSFSDNEKTVSHSRQGSFLEQIDFTVSEAGGTVTGSLEKEGGGDLTQFWSDDFDVLDCTGPVCTVNLTALVGTDTTPAASFVYILQSAKTTLVANTSFPANSVEHIRICSIVLQSAATTGTEGALMVRNWNDPAFGITNPRGGDIVSSERVRKEHALYDSGIVLTITGSGTGTVTLDTTAGAVYQFNLQFFPAIDMAGADNIHLVNLSGSEYSTTSNLVAGITTLADGVTSLGNNKYFNIVVWGVQNRTGETSHLMCNLPTGQYNSSLGATTDSQKFSVHTIPSAFRGTGFLVAELTFRLTGGGSTWTLVQNKDLLGQIPTLVPGGGTTTAVSIFPDSSFELFDNGDSSKRMDFELSSITTGTTRTITMADNNINFETGLGVENGGTGATNLNAFVLTDGSNPLTSNWNINDEVEVLFGASGNASIKHSNVDVALVIQDKEDNTNDFNIFDFSDVHVGISGNNTRIGNTGDLDFVGAAGFYPVRRNQAGEPASGTGSTQIDTGEFLAWRDSDDGSMSLVFNDPTSGVTVFENDKAFLDLTDTPANYTDDAYKLLRVNVAETGLEYLLNARVVSPADDILAAYATLVAAGDMGALSNTNRRSLLITGYHDMGAGQLQLTQYVDIVGWTADAVIDHSAGVTPAILPPSDLAADETGVTNYIRNINIQSTGSLFGKTDNTETHNRIIVFEGCTGHGRADVTLIIGSAPIEVYLYGGRFTTDFDGLTLNSAANAKLFAYGVTVICDAQNISGSNPNFIARAVYAAGINTGATFELHGCTIIAKSSAGTGGSNIRSNAIFNTSGVMTAYSCDFSNTATDDGGTFDASCIENETGATTNLIGGSISIAEGEAITHTGGTLNIAGTVYDSTNVSGTLTALDQGNTKVDDLEVLGDVTLANALPIAQGGTGATTAQAAIDALLPSQGAHSGEFLTTDGSNSSWSAAGGGTMSSFTLAGDSGTQTISDGDTLDVAGGTGLTTVAGATDTVTVNHDAHTGEVTGSTALTLDDTAISGQDEAVITAADAIIFSDAGVIKRDTVQGILDLASAGSVSISGTPSADEFAQWTDATTIRGLAAANTLGALSGEAIATFDWNGQALSGIDTYAGSDNAAIVRTDNSSSFWSVTNSTDGASALASFRAASDTFVTTMVANSTSRTGTIFGEDIADAAQFNASSGASKLIIGIQSDNPIIFGTDTTVKMRIEGDGSIVMSPGTKDDGYVVLPTAEGTSSGTAATTLQTIPLLDDNVYLLDAFVVGIRTNGSDRAAYRFSATAYRESGGGATLQGAVSAMHIGESASGSNATFTVSGNNVLVTVTAGLSRDFQWGSTVRIINISG